MYKLLMPWLLSPRLTIALKAPKLPVEAILAPTLTLTVKQKFKQTYNAILTIRLRLGHRPAFLPFLSPILIQQPINNLNDRVRPYINRPVEVRDGIIADDLAQMAACLHGIACDATRRGNTGTDAHWDRISCMEHVGDVLCRGLHVIQRISI